MPKAKPIFKDYTEPKRRPGAKRRESPRPDSAAAKAVELFDKAFAAGKRLMPAKIDELTSSPRGTAHQALTRYRPRQLEHIKRERLIKPQWKGAQASLYSELFDEVLAQGHTTKTLSQATGVAAKSLRTWLLGGKLGSANLLKVAAGLKLEMTVKKKSRRRKLLSDADAYRIPKGA